MESEDQLFEACRVLFGKEIEISREFLCYLQDEGVVGAFRNRAMEVHPDRALISGISVEKCHEDFVTLQIACETLRRHIASRATFYRAAPTPAKQQRRSHLHTSDSRRSDRRSWDLPEEKLLFGRFLYRMGIIDWSQLIQAISWQKAGRPRIGELGIRLGYLDRNTVLAILKNSIKGGNFGVTAQNMGLLTLGQVRELLQRQKLLEKRIGQFFIEHGLLSQKNLTVLLMQFKAHNRRVERLNERYR